MTSPATPPTTTPAPATAAPRRTCTGRLGQGELRRQVAAHLAAHPGAHTPGEIARKLDRSSGAVANALTTLAEAGHAEQTGTHPRRYRATATTAEAAKGAPTGPAPGRAPSGGRASAPAAAGKSPSAPTTPTPGGSARSTAGKGGTTGVVRPNGQTYHPRVLADLPDVTALQRLRQAGIPALLYGPPGTGKTSLVEAAHPDLITVAGDGDTTVADFVGEYTQAPGGGYEFVYGPLVTAMTEGRCLFIDDATLISPSVLAVVYPAMKAPEFVITEMPSTRTWVWSGAVGRVWDSGSVDGVAEDHCDLACS